MLEHKLPRLDVHRLKSSRRHLGTLQLRSGFAVRYVLNERDALLSLGIKGRPLYHYPIRQPPRHRLEARRPKSFKTPNP